MCSANINIDDIYYRHTYTYHHEGEIQIFMYQTNDLIVNYFRNKICLKVF